MIDNSSPVSLALRRLPLFSFLSGESVVPLACLASRASLPLTKAASLAALRASRAALASALSPDSFATPCISTRPGKSATIEGSHWNGSPTVAEPKEKSSIKRRFCGFSPTVLAKKERRERALFKTFGIICLEEESDESSLQLRFKQRRHTDEENGKS